MVHCKNKSRNGNIISINQIPDVTVEFAKTISEISDLWIDIMPQSNLFFQPDYLNALEKSPPIGVKLGYLLFKQGEDLVGGAILQVQYFRANQNIRYDDSEKVGFFGTMSKFFRNLVASRVEFHTLVCGSMLLTGEHGFYFKEGLFSDKDQLEILDNGLTFAQSEYEKQGIQIAGNLLKDFFQTNHSFSSKLTNFGYHEFQVQPNMILHQVASRWDNFDAYLTGLTSKYRVRYKRARKKSKELSKRELSLEEMMSYRDRMYELYNEVADNSGFNLVNLNREYLISLKRSMPNKFKVVGYFEAEKLVGFITTLNNGEELEAHFLGFEKRLNRTAQLYLNMLYDILAEGIAGRYESIVYARTAMEIKSSLGAEGFDMHCYLKHQNTFTNRLLPSILNVLKPEKAWEPRNPFKNPLDS